MPRLPLALVVVATLCGAARAETVHSYAYVTDVERLTSSLNAKYDKNQCRVTAKLPQAILAAAPADDDTALVGSASEVRALVDDPRDHCTSYTRTWQPVTYERGRRDRVEFDWPHGPITVSAVLGLGLLVFVIGWGVRYRLQLRKRRA